MPTAGTIPAGESPDAVNMHATSPRELLTVRGAVDDLKRRCNALSCNPRMLAKVIRRGY